MRIALLLPLLASVVSACGTPDDRSAHDVDSDSVRAAALAPELAGACLAVGRITRASLHIAVGRDRATSFRAPRQNLGTWRGCRFVGSGIARPGTNPPTPDGLLQQAFLAEGWMSDPQLSADGVVGTELALRKAATRCVATIGYKDVGIGAAPAAVVPDSARKPIPYRVEIRCTDGAPSVR